MKRRGKNKRKQQSPDTRTRRQDPLSQLREMVRGLEAEGKHAEAAEVALSALESVLKRNAELELLLEKLRRQQLRRTTEKMNPSQLMLLFEELKELEEGIERNEELEAQSEAALAEEVRQAEQEAKAASESNSKLRRRRGDWTGETTEREIHRHEPNAADLTCGTCGLEMSRIGEDVTRRLEFVPARFVDHEHRLGKYACGRCKDAVITAPAPPQVLEGSGVGASVLANVVTSKFVDHSPLTRLNRVYGRMGAQIPVSTMCDWVGGAGDLIRPLADCVAEELLTGHVVTLDASGIKVLDPTAPDNVQRGTMWCYTADRRLVLFRYTPTGEGAGGPWSFLAGRTGYVQADAASVHDRLFNGEVASAVEVACWSHARRKYHDLKDSDPRVAHPLKQIQLLYRIERLADLRKLAPDKRLLLRQERSPRFLDNLRTWAQQIDEKEPPSSHLARACRYMMNHWQALTRFLEDGRIELDNNFTENQIRDLALGRKNYLFAGSHDAARNIADIYSLTRTCAVLGANPFDYLSDVLHKLGTGWKQSRLSELLPHRWLETRPL